MYSQNTDLIVGLANKNVNIGIIGLSVHSADFTEIINPDTDGFSGCNVTALFHPKGNEDVEFSVQQLKAFGDTIKNHGVEVVDSMAAVVENVDAVMLLTNDGRPHLEQLIPILKAGKLVFIDKPIADTLPNVLAVFEASRQYGVPVFSSSALRYGMNVQDVRQGKIIGKVMGADVYAPAPIQPSHVDLFWDGVHGVEMLYTVMGPGCQSVSRSYTVDGDVVVGTWKDGRIGVFRGLRRGKTGFGGLAYGAEGITPVGAFVGYSPLVKAIVDFFRTHNPPVEREETTEIYGFMQAADESKRLGGTPVDLSTVLLQAVKSK